jgi:hypothetical protein
MSVSKRFKKKIKNFRQGMTAWRVHSYPIRDENYRDWGKDQEELDRKNGKGNSTCFHTGSTWMFITCERICKAPEKSVWGWSDWIKGKGKRRTHSFKSLQSSHGSDGNRFFSKQHQAQAFMKEIIEGKHPDIIGGNIYLHSELDRLDDILDDFSKEMFDAEYDYSYNEAEFA